MTLSRSSSACDGDRDSLFEPRGLDGQIVVEKRQLLAERHERPVGVSQRRTQQVAELTHQPARGLRIGFGERADRVERIEQEVRLELCAQALKARLDQASLEIRGLQRQIGGLTLALAHLCGVVARYRHAGDHRVDHQVGIEALEEELADVVGPRGAAQRPGPETENDGQQRERNAERHVQRKARDRRRHAVKPLVDPEHERREQAPRVPTRDAPFERHAPRQPRKIELRGEDNAEQRPQQER